MNEELKNNEMVDEVEIMDAEVFDDDAEIDEYSQPNVGKIALVGAGVAAATVGVGLLVKKVVVPRIGTAKEKFADWREARKEAKLEKKEAKEKTEYIQIEGNESKSE